MTVQDKQDLDIHISHMQVLKGWLCDSLTQKAFKKSIDIAIESMKKQIPKKPKIKKTDDKALFKCPCCDNVLLEEFYGVVTIRHGHIEKHCENCGQAIWKEGGTND